MSKAIVVYQSKYGATKKYAQWIAEELSCDMLERKNITTKQLLPYDLIIYGAGLYAGGLSGSDLITKSYNMIKNKNIIVFTCGLADPKDEENVKGIMNGLNKIFSLDMQQNIKFFHLRGSIDYSKLDLIHKSMMAMLYKMLLKKDYDTLRSEDKEMLSTYGKIVDFTDITTIQPIISYLKEL